MNHNEQTRSYDNTFLEPVFVARQPVFDVNMDIWGYELLFRHSAKSGTADFEDGDVATAQVIADGFGMAEEWLVPGQKLLINYPSSMLLQGTARTLPANIAVVEILETVRPDQDILDMCLELKNEGYILALDDFVGDPGFEPLLEQADIVKVDVLNIAPGSLEGVLERLEKYSCTLLAEKVENLESFEQCKEMGFELFQGYFFSKPKIVQGRRLSANQLSKLELIDILGSDNLDLAGIARIIEGDVSLSYRLLRYINSVSTELPYKINSISHAVNMLGQRRVSTWLQVIILAEMNTTARASELLFLSLQRAKFLELIALQNRTSPMSPDSMFILGLFSMLDALLSQPMKDILEKISLEPSLTQALTGENKELRIWLDLAVSCEKGEWKDTEDALKKIGISPGQAALVLNKATAWAGHFLSMT
ncbi:MAG: EAL and HDOD domain-containing protein [Desulfonatronovibrio sp.]